MAGGTWTVQNKVRPGMYINFEGNGTNSTVGGRGTVTFAASLPWGAAKQVIAIHPGDDLMAVLGYDVLAPQLLLVREALKRAQTVLVYRLNTGEKATATIGDVTVTAKHGGVRGNDISIVVQHNVADNNQFDVKTMVGGREMDVQTVAQVSGLQPNDWVVWGTTGTLEETAGVTLAGGSDGTVVNQDHTDYLAAMELHEFQTMALPSTAADLKGVYGAFIRRMRETEGKKVQLVVENDPQADYEGILSVKNGVILADGTTVSATQATVWVAAATAGAAMNESLTYAAYDGAVDVSERYANSTIVAALQAGELLFTIQNGRVVVEQDRNTWTSVTPAKPAAFSKNRVIRVLDSIANDLSALFNKSFLGKVNNNEDGRTLFWNACVNYLSTLNDIAAIQQFEPRTDVVVLPGDDADSVVVEVQVQPVDAIEKIYMKVRVM